VSAFVDPFVGALDLLADPRTWIYVAIGTLFGILTGALPGLATTLGYALLLPFTFQMDTVFAVTMLLSLTVGVAYGNNIPSILVGVPGTPAAVLTVLDGYSLHRKGETGLALGVAFISANLGQVVSIFFFIGAVVPLAGIAYNFLNPELFSLYVFGIVAIVSLTGKSMLKGLMAAGFGFLLAMVGLDPVNWTPRFDFGFFRLRSGLSVPALLIGLLAVSELFRQARQTFQYPPPTEESRAKSRFPAFRRWKRAIPAMLGGTVVGTIVGAIPGAGGTPAALIAYQQAQMFSKHPEEFGTGSIEGIAANEAAQNASSSGELIPTLGLGIPGSGSMVLLLAALTLNGFIPGPQLIDEAPQLLYATVAGLLGASIFVMVFGWPMARSLHWVLTLDRSVVIIAGLVTISLGIYSLNYRLFDVAVCFAAGMVGYFMLRYGYSTAAAALALVLAAGLEASFRRGLTLTGNNYVEFFARPITAAVMLLSLTFLVIGLVRTHKFHRREAARLVAGDESLDAEDEMREASLGEDS